MGNRRSARISGGFKHMENHVNIKSYKFPFPSPLTQPESGQGPVGSGTSFIPRKTDAHATKKPSTLQPPRCHFPLPFPSSHIGQP